MKNKTSKVIHVGMVYYNHKNERKAIRRLFVDTIEGFNETYFLNTLPEKIRTDIKLIEDINIYN